MKFAMDIYSRSTRSPDGKTVWTEVRIGTVKLLIKDKNFLYAIQNKEEVYKQEGADEHSVFTLWIGSGQIVQKADLQTMMFHLNRMLYEQAIKIMEPIMDAALKRKDE